MVTCNGWTEEIVEADGDINVCHNRPKNWAKPREGEVSYWWKSSIRSARRESNDPLKLGHLVDQLDFKKYINWCLFKNGTCCKSMKSCNKIGISIQEEKYVLVSILFTSKKSKRTHDFFKVFFLLRCLMRLFVPAPSFAPSQSVGTTLCKYHRPEIYRLYWSLHPPIPAPTWQQNTERILWPE